MFPLPVGRHRVTDCPVGGESQRRYGDAALSTDEAVLEFLSCSAGQVLGLRDYACTVFSSLPMSALLASDRDTTFQTSDDLVMTSRLHRTQWGGSR